MTSRAEYRLLLRQDNADMRLTPKGYEVGIISAKRYKKFLEKRALIEQETIRLRNTYISGDKLNDFLSDKRSAPVMSGISLSELLKRPEICNSDLKEIDENRPYYFNDTGHIFNRAAAEQVELMIKYEGYIKRQLLQVEQYKKLESRMIPEEIKFSDISGLRIEARQKLEKLRPVSVGQASRISGVSPADISVLLVYLEKWGRS
jgi:tRNA uridine 5-carboxymethylaminomethyl modification enzyme